ncbi:MAG: hypothetical protein EPN47_11085 [Acidobacteria bacterium]|nr:MAG: hypothetical protein EPN47_11085 [Acidobacteriota bacterium]
MHSISRRQFLQAGAAATVSFKGLKLDDPRIYADRWVYVPTGLQSEAELKRVQGIARTAASHGLNGMLLSSGFDQLDLKSQEYLGRLTSLKKWCDDLKVEIIPIGFSVGYGSGVMAHNRNLAAGVPVHRALFVAREHEAHFVPDSPAKLLNGGFEAWQGNLPAGFSIHGGPASIDTAAFHSGKASVRFPDFDGASGERYLEQEVRTTPYRCYRLRCWVKTEDVSPETRFHFWAIAPDGRNLSYLEHPLKATSDWNRVDWAFNSWYADHVTFRVGIADGKARSVWVDDVELEEIGLTNVLRRPGTPVVVRNEKTGEVYQEGRDYAPIADPHLNFRWDHDGPSIRLPAGSRIRPGDRLRADYFHSLMIYHDQVPIDMSEPEVYEIWKRQIPLIEKFLAPKKYFLSMDEVRIGGFCKACKDRHLSMAEILGDCVNRQAEMIRAVNPRAEVFVWSDMFDPNHNALKQYYLIDGSFDGTWKYLPKNMVIVCWYYEKRDLSLPFFSKLGYQTLAGAYYDADNLDNPKGWLQSLDRTPGAIGIMYTTWQDKYKLLPAFGDLVSRR